MLEAFNQQLVAQCGEEHAAALASIHLPTDAVSQLFKATLFFLGFSTIASAFYCSVVYCLLGGSCP